MKIGNKNSQPTAQLESFKKQAQKAAELYEHQFLKEMVKSMRATVSHSQLSKPSMAEEYFRDRLDNKYTEDWSQRGGVGLAKIVYEQLMERYAPVQKTGTAENPESQVEAIELKKKAASSYKKFSQEP